MCKIIFLLCVLKLTTAFEVKTGTYEIKNLKSSEVKTKFQHLECALRCTNMGNECSGFKPDAIGKCTKIDCNFNSTSAYFLKSYCDVPDVLKSDVTTGMPESAAPPLSQCDVVAVRNSGAIPYIFFQDSNYIWAYSSGAENDIVTGTNHFLTDTKSSYVPDVASRNPTAIFRANSAFYIFFSTTVENHVGSPYAIQAGFPKALADEYGPTAPAYVSAASYDESQAQFIYLFNDNSLYKYEVSGMAPAWSYTFVETFDFTINAANNPFSVIGPRTTAPFLAQPPSHVTAFYSHSPYNYAWRGKTMFKFHTTGEWENLGTIVTPCG